MPRKKAIRLAEVHNLPNVFTEEHIKEGTWRGQYPDSPIILELGCGTGAYTIALAERFPEKLVIGMDYQGERIWLASTETTSKNVPNAIFFNAHADHLTEYFRPHELSEIWITFPDPHPKKRNIKKRLTAPKFLERYKTILNPEGIVHLKTDNKMLYEYTLEILQEFKYTIVGQIEDVHNKSSNELLRDIKTTYEKKYLAEEKPIYYVSFQFK